MAIGARGQLPTKGEPLTTPENFIPTYATPTFITQFKIYFFTQLKVIIKNNKEENIRTKT